MHTIVSLIFDSKFSDNTHFYPVLVFVYYMRKNTRDFNDIRLLRVAVKRLTYHTHTHTRDDRQRKFMSVLQHGFLPHLEFSTEDTGLSIIDVLQEGM